ncbi:MULTISPECIES: hypothetical protein [Clostridium]|uniref:Carboxypeptidase regulatory-like domain-containing protein n=1 Tax=Clostridium brassicae TaxID=2999072 RepID=A0ABT4D9F9_9CLOT|nr:MULTISPECIES: hypothetical protein [Clostridium]MCY6958950.1 hypothetical protein [Clostridium brassicae]WMJ80616.1 hypothetical protein RBU49_17715 [Clostridium sp. MB40-C1]
MGKNNEQYYECGQCETDNINKQGEFVLGNVTKEIEVTKDIEFSEIRADINVKKVKTLRVWGQVKDCDGKPVKNALLKLVRVVKDQCGKVEYVGVAHGVSDCLGFYQFDICVPHSCNANVYRIFVSKQALGKEGYITATECNPCLDNLECAK